MSRELLTHSFAARILPEHSSHRCTSHSSDETWQLSNRHLVRIYPSLLRLATNSQQMHISTREIHFLPISHARLRTHGSTCVFQTEKQFYGNRALFSFLGDAHSDALSTRNDGDGRKSFSLSLPPSPTREISLLSSNENFLRRSGGAKKMNLVTFFSPSFFPIVSVSYERRRENERKKAATRAERIVSFLFQSQYDRSSEPWQLSHQRTSINSRKRQV